MRILCTSNPLVGHWLPMLPFAQAAQQAGHEVVIATGPDAVPEIEWRRLTAWPIGSDLLTVANGIAMFADPAIARAHDLLDRMADWRPDMVVQEIYELGGTYVPAPLACAAWAGGALPELHQARRVSACLYPF